MDWTGEFVRGVVTGIVVTLITGGGWKLLINLYNKHRFFVLSLYLNQEMENEINNIVTNYDRCVFYSNQPKVDNEHIIGGFELPKVLERKDEFLLFCDKTIGMLPQGGNLAISNIRKSFYFIESSYDKIREIGSKSDFKEGVFEYQKLLVRWLFICFLTEEIYVNKGRYSPTNKGRESFTNDLYTKYKVNLDQDNAINRFIQNNDVKVNNLQEIMGQLGLVD